MMTLGIFNQSLRNKSVAWRNVGFVKNNVKEQYSQQQIDAASRLIQKYPRNHECYVPDNHNDWHTQIRCIMNDLLRIQKKKGLKWLFTIDGKKQTTEYRLIFRVLFFAGDTMEHNKMCSLRGGNMGKFPCRMCSITRSRLDSPNNIPISTLTNGNIMQQIRSQNPTALKAMGYYPCHSNVLYELQYCDPGGLNHSVPPDILHAILLGYFTRLINGFVRLKQINNDKLFVFSDSFLGQVERDLSSVGKALSQQSDPDLPKTHFP